MTGGRARRRSTLKNVSPVRMFGALGVHIGAERDDFHALRPRVLDEPRGELPADRAAAHAVRHESMVGDDEMRIDAAVGQLRFLGNSLDAAYIAALALAVLAADRDIAHALLLMGHAASRGQRNELPVVVRWQLKAAMRPIAEPPGLFRRFDPVFRGG